jgi:23S rRNA pseudouridine2457 synthase
MSQIILLNKPYNVLPQFSDRDGREHLGNYVDQPGVYPAGRLDRDSEGLMVLTDDGALQHKISHPDHKMTKTYWVQVEGEPTENDLQPLADGLALNDGTTLPAKYQLGIGGYSVWPRTPPYSGTQVHPGHLAHADDKRRQKPPSQTHVRALGLSGVTADPLSRRLMDLGRLRTGTVANALRGAARGTTRRARPRQTSAQTMAFGAMAPLVPAAGSGRLSADAGRPRAINA